MPPSATAAPAPPAEALAGEAVAGYLHAHAADFLRSLKLHGESGADTAAADRAAGALRRTARRIGGTLHTFRPLLDPDWADGLRTELDWLSTTLAQEHACTSRLTLLLDALTRLSGAGPGPSTTTGALPAGAARAGALLERQLTLARTRAHSAALGALGSARFHALADAVALLSSDLPLRPLAATRADTVLLPVAADAERRLLEAAAALPLGRAGHPYNADALVHGLGPAPGEEAQDAPWHRVRRLLRLHRYALEVLEPLRPGGAPPALTRAGRLLDRHRDAAEAAEAAAAAARTPRIAPATAYALGILHADQRHEVEAARFAFQEVWPGSLAIRTRTP
ncbi:CHAD domain-containing protein [Streptomyces qinzhouensis]|uniref:CHAD domain-containing protein n=1 Tax=Streptomyces qinzhouensis TaxID=2599401 RepID=UPI001FEBCD7A|nr:CHAD domain-containing protein [Streptomyces qinzhouensis]